VCFWNVDPVFNPFSSRFVRDAFAMPRKYPCTPEFKVKMANPALLMAIKLEAFQGRGQGNFQNSDDLNDIVALLAARAELAFDLKLAAPTVKMFVQKTLAEYKPKHDFQEAIKRILNNDAALIELATQRLSELVRIDLK
jgi:predicted nucleotidyltransferase